MTRQSEREGELCCSDFLDAQAPVINRALDEIEAGRKATHWMWFVFPQLSALARSETARRFGIATLECARRYLADPVLGARLRLGSQLALRANVGAPNSNLGSRFVAGHRPLPWSSSARSMPRSSMRA